jgi:hypothetical protein
VRQGSASSATPNESNQNRTRAIQSGRSAVPWSKLEHGPRRTLRRLRSGFWLSRLTLRLALAETWAVIRECGRSVLAFPARIQWIYGTRRTQCQVFGIPSLHGLVGECFEECTRSRACISDIRSFWASHPWATVVEREIFREAWLAGSQWAAYNPDSCKSCLAYDADLKRGNSMPLLTIPQDSKCDLSAPLPLRE